MEVIALCFLCIAVGVLIGYEWACIRERKRDVAPVPDFDKTNPINARCMETITECGVEWEVRKPNG